MIKQVQSSAPLKTEQLNILKKIISECSPLQLAWISGYFWGKATEEQLASGTQSNQLKQQNAEQPIVLLSASQTGNARRLTEQLRDNLIAAELNVKLINAGDYKLKQITQEKFLILVTSTQGDGEPPEEAIALYKYLFSKKAPCLLNLQFAVFGLGDSSYNHFAKAGKDFDNRLEELGAKRIHKRIDADVDYYSQAEDWCTKIVKKLKTSQTTIIDSAKKQLSIDKNIYKINFNCYNKNNPFNANLLINQRITSRQSHKDVRHIEIDISGSDLYYHPGDSLGIWYENDPTLINEFLKLLSLKSDELVEIAGKILSLAEALKNHYELTQNTKIIVKKYAALSRNKELLKIAEDEVQLEKFTYTTPIINMIRKAPTTLYTKQFLSLLRPLTPRLYSIASSQAEVGEEVHITVSVVRYEIDGQFHTGGASGFLADRVTEGSKLKIFIEHNNNFRLPNDSKIPIIMIGSGTGVAPFRAFLQQREFDRSTGQNWLFFGNPHFIHDFLYQVEWQRYFKEGLLKKIDLAWSRDQQQKIYVQHKIIKKGNEVWSWIKHGAHIYVCGNANHMAHGVEQSLLSVIMKHGNMNIEQADQFLNDLRINRRYQRDVY